MYILRQLRLIILTHLCFSDSHSWCFTLILSLTIAVHHFHMPAMNNYVSSGFLRPTQQDRSSIKEWPYAPEGAPLTSGWIQKLCFLFSVLHAFLRFPGGVPHQWHEEGADFILPLHWLPILPSLDSLPPTGVSCNSQRND